MSKNDAALAVPEPENVPTWVTGGEEWNMPRVTGELRLLLRRTTEDIFEVGKRLLWVEHQLGYGNFEKWLEEKFATTPRTAYRYMAVARKLAPIAPPGPFLTHVSEMGPSKLYALLEVDDSDLKEYLKGGDLMGFTSDEVDKMSSAELRTLARKNRQNKQRYQVAAEEVRALRAEIKALRDGEAPGDEQETIDLLERMKNEVFRTLYLARQISEGEMPARVRGKMSGVLQEIERYARELSYELLPDETTPKD